MCIRDRPGTITATDPVTENLGTIITTDFHDYLTPDSSTTLTRHDDNAESAHHGRSHPVDPNRGPRSSQTERLRQHLVDLIFDPDAYRQHMIRIKDPHGPPRLESGKHLFVPFSSVTQDHVGSRIFAYGPVFNIKTANTDSMDYEGFYINSGPYLSGSFSIFFHHQQARKVLNHYRIDPQQKNADLYAIAYGTVRPKNNDEPKINITDHTMISFARAPQHPN